MESSVTNSAVTLVDSDEGKAAKVRVSSSADDGNDETLTGAATPARTTTLSDDATLSDPTLTGARLYPTFAGGTTSYTASVGYTVAQTTVTATTNGSSATLRFLDSGNATFVDADTGADGLQMNLSVGENVVKVEVAAQDGVATETYLVTVTRAALDTSLSPPASDPAASASSAALYSITFHGTWTTDVTPGGLPGSAHFSRLIGGVHNAGVIFLESGGTAGSGVESMAETGEPSNLLGEVQAAINATPPTALGVLEGSTSFIGPTAGRTLSDVTLTSRYPRVTLTTMIAPSHDWFVGVSGLPLLDSQGRRLASREVDPFPWDAGTEDGDDFSLSPSVATNPQGVIASGTGSFSAKPIAMLTFTRQSLPPSFPATESGARAVPENHRG